MAAHEWQVTLDRPHTITVERAATALLPGVSAGYTVAVDGQRVAQEEGLNLMDTGFEQRFELDGRQVLVLVRFQGFHYTYELWIDGKPQ